MQSLKGDRDHFDRGRSDRHRCDPVSFFIKWDKVMEVVEGDCQGELVSVGSTGHYRPSSQS